MRLLIDKRHRVLHIALNRPEKRNALDSQMCHEIVEAVTSAQHDHHVGSILITAVGQVFCAGMDLDEASSAAASDLSEIHEKLFSLGAESRKPIVICVNGAALGGGLGLVAQGHVVMAGHGSVFGLPEIRVGLWPFLVYRSIEVAIGTRRTLELSLTGRSFTAEEALAWGMVHRLCPQAEVCERARGLSRDIAKACPSAIAAGMQYTQESRQQTWHEAGALARSLREELMKSGDFQEGCAAFMQKRPPRWPSMPEEFYTNHGNRIEERPA